MFPNPPWEEPKAVLAFCAVLPKDPVLPPPKRLPPVLVVVPPKPGLLWPNSPPPVVPPNVPVFVLAVFPPNPPNPPEVAVLFEEPKRPPPAELAAAPNAGLGAPKLGVEVEPKPVVGVLVLRTNRALNA